MPICYTVYYTIPAYCTVSPHYDFFFKAGAVLVSIVHVTHTAYRAGESAAGVMVGRFKCQKSILCVDMEAVYSAVGPGSTCVIVSTGSESSNLAVGTSPSRAREEKRWPAAPCRDIADMPLKTTLKLHIAFIMICTAPTSISAVLCKGQPHVVWRHHPACGTWIEERLLLGAIIAKPAVMCHCNSVLGLAFSNDKIFYRRL